MENDIDVVFEPDSLIDFTPIYLKMTKFNQFSNQIPKKSPFQISMPSLNLNALEGKLQENTTHSGAFTERSDRTQPLVFNQRESHLQEKLRSAQSQSLKINENPTYNQQHRQNVQCHKPITLQRVRQIIDVSKRLGVNLWSKMMGHLKKTSTSDKYIRLVYSIFKLYRALNENNKLGVLSKELLNTRRIIQWECKYQLIKDFKTENLSAFQFSYKTFELLGNLFDFLSFWLNLFAKMSSSLAMWSETMYSWQDDCYFYQCLIELILSTKNLIKHTIPLLSGSHCKDKQYETFHKIKLLEESKQKLSSKMSRLKNLNEKEQLQGINSYVERIFVLSVLKRIQQKDAEISQIKQDQSQWNQKETKRIKKQVLKNLFKVLKYICDSTTSYNNWSWKKFNLNPVLGGILSILSSILSMYLIWGF